MLGLAEVQERQQYTKTSLAPAIFPIVSTSHPLKAFDHLGIMVIYVSWLYSTVGVY